MRHKFTVLGNPVPQHRPRFARMGKFVRTYNVKEDTNYREKLYWEVRHQALKPIPRPTALVVTIGVYRRLLSSFKGPQIELAEMGFTRPASRPDIDNYIKQVLDALNGLLWEDDGQIVRVICDKWYSATPRLEVEVSTLED